MQELSFWDSCLLSFEKSLPPQQFNSWIKPLKISSEDDRLILTAPNTFTLKVVQDRFFQEINRLAKSAYPVAPQFEFRVAEATRNSNCGATG